MRRHKIKRHRVIPEPTPLGHYILGAHWRAPDDYSGKTSIPLDLALDDLAIWMKTYGIRTMVGGRIQMREGKITATDITWDIDPDHQVPFVPLEEKNG